MSDMNDIDALVSARLSAAAGGEPDLNGAHAQVRRRVTRARRRRAAAITGSAGVSVLLLGTVYAMNTGDTSGRLTNAEAPTTIAQPQDDAPIGVSTTSPAIDSSVVSTTPETGVASTATSSPDGPASSAPNTDLQAGSTLAPGDDGGDREELFDVVVAATETRTLSGVGGAVDVRVEAGVLSFASYPVAAAGFTAAVTKGDPDELEVTFTSSTHRTRLRVRIDGNRLRADRSEESRPATSTATTIASTISGGGPVTTDHDTDDDNDHSGRGGGGGGDDSGGDDSSGSGSGGGERSDEGGTSGGSGSPDGSGG